MIVVDPGHVYRLAALDGPEDETVELVFVKREGDKYPGNVGAHVGTTTQEVLRALIDRTQYVDRQIPDKRNGEVIGHLRRCIELLEERAAERRGEELKLNGLREKLHPETIPACVTCGHIHCSQHTR